MSFHFKTTEDLGQYLREKMTGGLLITYRNCPDYAGMVLGIMLVFDLRIPQYRLDLQWMSWGLDFYGDTLQESYVYEFAGLTTLLDYLQTRYQIGITDIPVRYETDPDQFPNYLRDAAQRPLFEEAWQRFQADFASGLFLDPGLRLVEDSREGFDLRFS